MICAVINGPSYEEIRQQMAIALQKADLVEWRIDLFSDLNVISKIRDEFIIPIIFTLRSYEQGGKDKRSLVERLESIRYLASLNPEYLDLEMNIPCSFVDEITSRYPNIKIILSYHNFSETPQDLDSLYKSMNVTTDHYYKIALMANTAIDTMRFLCWLKKNNASNKLIAISMGTHGQISRIIAPLLGTPWTYASTDEHSAVAPGQLSIQTLTEIYKLPHKQKKDIYCLIGSPVTKSPSHLSHNAFFTLKGLNAVYIKIDVATTELQHFLLLAKDLPFKGLSVTMPLKESIISYLDHVDSEALLIGAVNTVLLKDGDYFGFNTDGLGALKAIEQIILVRGKRIVILGAGGAARAIAFEAHRRGAEITIVNRTLAKAQELAGYYQGRALNEFSRAVKDGYDILVNCTPIAMPIDATDIIPGTIVMDTLSRVDESPLLSCALERGCKVVYGYQMFIEQALLQFTRWFHELEIDEDDKCSFRNLPCFTLTLEKI